MSSRAIIGNLSNLSKITQYPTILPKPDQPSSKRYFFARQALSNLPMADQILFEQFGQGVLEDLPYVAVHHAFEAQVAQNPDAIAANHLGETITYGELNAQATRLATRLLQHGVETGDNVGIFLNRSIPMLVGILATLKVGAAYVPQHVNSTPEAQMRHVASVTNAKVILTVSDLKDKVPTIEGTACLLIDDIMQEPLGKDVVAIAAFKPSATIEPDNNCYILFTSGTTGKPNGVQVTHRNVCNIIHTEPGNLGIRAGHKVGQILNIAFDMAAWEIHTALSYGATLYIRGRDIEETIRKVDVVIATPTVLASFDADNCKNVSIVAVAGEPCPRPLAEKWSSFADFYNSCGPTETTIVNTVQHYNTATDGLTIGKPTPNNTVYVLNDNMQPCAIGEVGEMWAGGDCVSAGYLNNPSLNEDRYRPDPFLGEGRMMFRTRDLGRWTRNGELEHYGRTDDQVKVRGFRVELPAVSAILEAIPDCEHAVTLKFDNRTLVSFVAPTTVHTEAAKEAVASALPYYCVPEHVFSMEKLPRTSRGKVDKKALLEMAKDLMTEEAATPVNFTKQAETEVSVAQPETTPAEPKIASTKPEIALTGSAQ